MTRTSLPASGQFAAVLRTLNDKRNSSTRLETVPGRNSLRSRKLQKFISLTRRLHADPIRRLFAPLNARTSAMTKHSAVFDEVASANNNYAREFGDKGKLALPPARRFAI